MELFLVFLGVEVHVLADCGLQLEDEPRFVRRLCIDDLPRQAELLRPGWHDLEVPPEPFHPLADVVLEELGQVDKVQVVKDLRDCFEALENDRSRRCSIESTTERLENLEQWRLDESEDVPVRGGKTSEEERFAFVFLTLTRGEPHRI